MDHLQFMNSKTLFKVRVARGAGQRSRSHPSRPPWPAVSAQRSGWQEPAAGHGAHQLPPGQGAAVRHAWSRPAALRTRVAPQWERMKAVIRRWVDGDTKALDAFPVRGLVRRPSRKLLTLISSSGWVGVSTSDARSCSRAGVSCYSAWRECSAGCFAPSLETNSAKNGGRMQNLRGGTTRRHPARQRDSRAPPNALVARAAPRAPGAAT